MKRSVTALACPPFHPHPGLLAALPLSLALVTACSDSTSPNPGPGVPTSVGVAVGSGDDKVDSVGGTFVDTMVVQVKDRFGTGVPDTTVNWTVTAGTLSSSSGVTDHGGYTQVIWTFTIPPTTTVGTEAARFSMAVNSHVTSAEGITAEHGNPVPVKTGNGDNQSGAATTTLPHPLSIRVVDQHGNPIVNHSVTWTTPSGVLSPTATPGVTSSSTLVTVTGSDGTTQVYLTLGPAAGPNNVEATMGSGLTGEPASNQFGVTFTETALPLP